MRCTQYVGLPKDALKFLNENQKIEKCPCCGHTTYLGERTWKDASACGMFDDGPKLNEFELKDGSIVREEIQAVPWSSGPVIFTMLIDEKGNVLFRHSDKDIESA